MSTSYLDKIDKDFSFNEDEEVMDSIFKQYERVVIESIITSFGLDFLVNDRHGGDVDTIHNVRQIGVDKDMVYKNSANETAYQNNPVYDGYPYHSHENYIQTNREAKEKKLQGTLKDEYTGKTFAYNDKINLDHVISAKEIHEDKGRILAGLNGENLANSPENLRITNEHTNKSKKADSMDNFLNKKGNQYTDSQQKTMRKKDSIARTEYNRKLFVAYYTSPNFIKDTTAAMGTVGAEMGARQALGLFFSEIWFSVKAEFQKLKSGFDAAELFSSIKNGIERGIANAKEKFGKILQKFLDGAIAGAIGSLTTTLANIFFTTGKNIIRLIRQTWASLVEAIKILIFNPDRLLLGDRLKAAAKVLATGAAVVAGVMVSELVGKTGIGTIPVLGDIVQTFCGTFVTGILSCTLLYIMDRSSIVQKIVD